MASTEPEDLEPPLKRMKTELQRDSDYWFKSGNVVMVASNTVAYRVHSELLGRKSKVFKDLLDHDAPQPKDQELMDGCPVVHVSDAADHFSTFLMLIYDGWRYRDEGGYIEWGVIKVMLLLGDKYDCPEFRTQAIKHLQLTFPADISDWDSRQPLIQVSPEHAISMANLTRSSDTSGMHAIALYLCCSLPIATLMAGVAGRAGDAESLCLEDLDRCLQGREDLPKVWLDLHAKLFASPLPFHAKSGCVSGCEEVIEVMQGFCKESARRDLGPNIAYDIINRARWRPVMMDAEKRGMCSRCMSFYEGRLLRMRQQFRDGLEKRFQYVRASSAYSDIIELV
ncbi:hypothetical protein NM688_g7670 [Phlebia brevispora]|uniref:Uncharacterized protein n=1 Tax=Phlebia brevispora TaxID=194682 RepID=A0ACC1S2G8_9APHY|nr:hypothetical protein NM688_g7670 [Phlebia brevispora]